jgi:hypothetical protein
MEVKSYIAENILFHLCVLFYKEYIYIYINTFVCVISWCSIGVLNNKNLIFNVTSQYQQIVRYVYFNIFSVFSP